MSAHNRLLASLTMIMVKSIFGMKRIIVKDVVFSTLFYSTDHAYINIIVHVL